jgi:hypothetical protein
MHGRKNIKLETNLMYVCPCIIYEHDERYQLDATIVIFYHKYLYMFRAYICPSYLHYTHTTITATIHSMPPLHLCISIHSSEHNMYM